jgi:MFS family permease
MLAVGSLLGGLSGSYIAASHGWRWVQWTNVILSGGNFLLCLVFLPETLFDRAKAMQYDEVGPSSVAYEKDQTKTIEKVERPSVHKPYTFARSLSIGVYRGGLAHQFVAPYRTLLFPGVWMVMLQYAGLVGGIVTISTVGPQLVSVPPYLWGANAGLVNVGGVVGTVLGAVFTYLIVDRSLTAQAKKEAHGYGEPETRLQTQFPGLIMATFGLWIFGACAANPAPGRWVGLEFGLGMVCFGLMQAPSVGFNYVSLYHFVHVHLAWY